MFVKSVSKVITSQNTGFHGLVEDPAYQLQNIRPDNTGIRHNITETPLIGQLVPKIKNKYFSFDLYCYYL